jgi:hypothetical protein
VTTDDVQPDAPRRVKGNLLRNPALTLRWPPRTTSTLWNKNRKAGWRSEAVPVVPGARYRLEAEWKGPGAKVTVHWSTHEREGRRPWESRSSTPPRSGPSRPRKESSTPSSLLRGLGMPDEALAYVALPRRPTSGESVRCWVHRVWRKE